ncbi:MAG: hypothetical protein EU530_11735 [Promethearchaeota archaeon]|nr:MAG: hypothetical protein EU530_11735 [Candidatus Lokiarchaeota archaeon]
MSSQKTQTEEKKKLLYSYWHELPYIKSIDSTVYFQVWESEIKNFINKYIRDGIEDDFGREHNLLRRHAFTAKELHAAYLNQQKDQNYSQSNFHFHIKALVEEGYLQEIAKILEGRHYVSYYGRTAKSFVSQFDNILTTSAIQDDFGPIKELIIDMNPDSNPESINQLVDEFILSLEDYYFRFFSWVKEKYPHIYKSKVDLRSFLDIVGHYSFFHSELRKNSEKIGRLLDLDKIMDYERYEVENKK